MDDGRGSRRARRLSKTATALVVLLASARSAGAQIYETVGIRAQGMGGAFVAVADDATATWWNPAGLANGAFFSAILEHDVSQTPHPARDASGAALPSWRSSAHGFAVAFPALGLSYYHLRVSEIRLFGPTAAPGLSREDQRRAPVLLSSLVLQQFGATVGQSVGDHLVFGSTLRLVRGAFRSIDVEIADASLDRASGLDGKVQTRGDLDLGAMAAFGAVRLGVAVKHVTRPTFESRAGGASLPRQARLGLAATSVGDGAVGPVTVALDADLTRTPTSVGDDRHLSAGLEAWLLRRRLGVRSGFGVQTTGEARPVGSGGLSLAVRGSLFLEAQATVGADQARRGWGIALRAAF